MSGLVTEATLAWFLETIISKSLGWGSGSGDAATLDVVAYGG